MCQTIKLQNITFRFIYHFFDILSIVAVLHLTLPIIISWQHETGLPNTETRISIMEIFCTNRDYGLMKMSFAIL